MFYLSDFLRTSSTGAVSQISMRDYSEEIREELQNLQEFCNKSQVEGNIKRLLSNLK